MAEHDLNKLAIDKQRPGPGSGRRRVWKTVAIVASILILAAVAVKFLLPAVVVETVTVSLVYPTQTFTALNASGYVVAQRKAAVAPKTTGQLEWLGVAEGSRVTAGQLLARLESRDTAAGRDQAEANLAVAKANLEQSGAERTDAARSFDRIRELLAGGVVSSSDFDTADARLKRANAAYASMSAAVSSAMAALTAARVAFDYSMIRAPFDGVVLTKNADVGDIVTPIGAAANAKAAVVTIADLGSVQVEADVSESNLARVKVGQPCEIQLDALPDARFRGRLLTIVPTADRSKASVMVKVGFLDPDKRILPEMSAKVAFLEREASEADRRPRTVVPSVAVPGGRQELFIVKGDRVQKVGVTLGSRIAEYVEVTSGVKAGDTIVNKPSPKLADGMKVRMAEKK